jgi:hypothetical protein
MSIVSAAGQHRPGDARQFVGDRHHDLTGSTLGQPVHPLESSGVVLDAEPYRSSTVDQHATQIDVAALADTVQVLLASGGVLSGHDPNPGRAVASATKGGAVADSRHSGGGDQRAEAWDLPELPAARIFITDVFNLVADRLPLGLDLLPLLPPAIQQPAPARAQVLVGLFDDSGQVLAQRDRLRRKGDAALQQESAGFR